MRCMPVDPPLDATAGRKKRMACRLIQLESVDQLRAEAARWDDLWQRSSVAMPTVRASQIALWLEHFAPRAAFRALIVEDAGRWVAGLPLVGRSPSPLLSVGGLPENEWTAAGDLLLDPMADSAGAVDVLVAAMGTLPWPLLRLADVEADADRWAALLASLDRVGVAWDYQPRIQLGRIPIDHDWNAQQNRWSRKHRQQMARKARRLSERGRLRLVFKSELAPEEVVYWLRRGFAVEDRGWKGEAGTSVLRTPGMFAFFLRQAEQLAQWGQIELVFLECDGQPIAFAYGMSAKGDYFSYKVGYDPAYAAYSPGQLLRYYLYERLFTDPRRRAIEYMAPTPAHRRWKPDLYTVGRLLIAPSGGPRRWAVAAAVRSGITRSLPRRRL